MAKQSIKQPFVDDQKQLAPGQAVQKSKNIELLCLSEEGNDSQSIRPEILSIAKLLARVAVDNYLQTVISASQNL